MSASPQVTVLLPVRDAEATIGAAVRSVLDQTDSGFELLLVDDGSTDSTPELLRAAAASDPRVRVLRLESDGDLVAALERGRREARGELVMRMDADDVCHPRRLELERAALVADPRVAVVGCLVRSFPEATVSEGRLRYDAWLNGLRRHEDMARERFVESPLAHPSVLFRADAVAEVGGYRDLSGPEDYDLWLRLLAAGYRIEKVPRVLLFWREAPGRLSRTDPRYDASGFARVRAEALLHHLDGAPAAILGAGTAGRRLARALLELGGRVVFFLEVDPKKVGRAPYGIPVLAHEEALANRSGEVIVSCVNAWGARAGARAWLGERGLLEGTDFLLAS